MTITWRDVFDCKIGGTDIGTCEQQAKGAGYKLYCHNGRIFGKVLYHAYDRQPEEIFCELLFITPENLFTRE